MDLFLSIILLVLLGVLYAFHQQQRLNGEPGIYFIGPLFDLIADHAAQSRNLKTKLEVNFILKMDF